MYTPPPESDRYGFPASSIVPAPHIPRPLRILIVDDDPQSRDLIYFVLRRSGYEMDKAENGRMGIDMILAAEQTDKPYEVVLMDLDMPVMDGCEAVRELRANGFQRPIIAVTSYAEPNDRERCRQAGFTDFLDKPSVRLALLGMVARYEHQLCVRHENGYAAQPRPGQR